MFNPFKGKPGAGEKLSIYLSDTIEVGFSPYGPMLAVSGTLSTTGKYVFVYNMSLQVTKAGENYQRQFLWFVFRPHQFKLGGFHGIDLKMPSKFMVTANESRPYNILFTDNDTFADMKPMLTGLKRNWEDFVQEKRAEGKPIDSTEIFSQFKQRPGMAPVMANLKQFCYWEPGDYDVRLVVMTERVGDYFEVRRKFSLTAEDIELLDANYYFILADICKQPVVRYSFASPKLTQ